MLTEETLLPYATAVERVTGQRPNPSTLHRWRIRGVKGVKCETILAGGRRMSSIPAVHRFFAGITAAADGTSPAPRTNRQREAAIARAEAELEKAGV
jgi:hypothetical protein